ncbi:choice-of-anchor I family protein [Cerasicoccus fimbriatus]|uniref:choice-of-anchor I family protein n=1 Tax=Cerasicoccus fimbriatus TaxID=3014554 RepID=UPI0022B4F226|nr:choice-of-anchor I family protein [Cerasicoccus sp. TK19100]
MKILSTALFSGLSLAALGAMPPMYAQAADSASTLTISAEDGMTVFVNDTGEAYDLSGLTIALEGISSGVQGDFQIEETTIIITLSDDKPGFTFGEGSSLPAGGKIVVHSTGAVSITSGYTTLAYSAGSKSAKTGSTGAPVKTPRVGATSYTLQVLHASDLEGGIDAIGRAPNFAALAQHFEENPGSADGTMILSAGDNIIPGPFFSASSDFSLEDDLRDAYESLFGISLTDGVEGSEIETRNGAIDITIMNIVGFDASAIGNHEFDLGSETLRDLIEEEFDNDRIDDPSNIVGPEIEWPGTTFPYLSANLDFSGDADLSGIVTSDILDGNAFAFDPADLNKFPQSQYNSTKIGKAAIFSVNGQNVGIVGATTQRLNVISSPSGTVVVGVNDNDMALLATQLQPVIDQVLLGLDGIAETADDVNKVILVTHLQQIALEEDLATRLTDVDVIIAGGSDTLLADANDTLRPGDVADDVYPVQVTDINGDTTLIVSTDGEYSYLGRLNVPFDTDGLVVVNDLDDSINGPVASTDAMVQNLWGDLTAPFAAGTRGGLVKALVDEVEGIVLAQDGNIYGYTAEYLVGDRELVRTQETNLGNLTADANLWKALQSDPEVVISFKNGGGIRTPIGVVDGITGELLPPQGNPAASKPVGAISELDVANVLRFNNGLVTFTLSGQDLLEVLEYAVSRSFAGRTEGRFPQISGMQFSYYPVIDSNDNGEYDAGIDTPAMIRSIALMGLNGRVTRVIYDDGAFVDSAATEEFKMVTLNFLAGGGDGYPFADLQSDLVDLEIGEVEALQEYLTSNFGTAGLAYSQPEMDPTQDARIQNLDERYDSVGNDIPVAPAGALRLTPVATFNSGLFDEAGAEIVAYHAGTQRLFVVSSAASAAEIRVLDASNPSSGELPQINAIVAPQPNFEPNSVDTFTGALGDAVAIAWSDESGVAGRGVVTLHNPSTLAMIGSPITVGFLPDMLTFTADGNQLVVANEGEMVGSDNPEGSVSIIDFSGSFAVATHTEVTFDRWNRREDVLRSRGVLLTQIDAGLAENVAQDLEPEYVAISPDGETAWVGLQEANAVAIIDLKRYAVRNILPLGTINYGMIPLDASDRDEGEDDEPINVTFEPGLYGLPQPDAIAFVEFEGMSYLLTANEGDARDFEELRFKDIGDAGETTYVFDPAVISTLAPLQENDQLGRLEINLVASDLDKDGDIDVPMVFGGRSMSVYEAPVVGRFRQVGGTSANGNNDLDEFTASIFPNVFHSNNDDNDSLESRSDAKGVEPEALTVAEIDGQTYAFLGLERQSAIMIYNVTDPRTPQFVAYVSNRNYMVDADTEEAGDLGPEGIEFIPASDSPLGVPTIAVANEISGTVTLYSIESGI